MKIPEGTYETSAFVVHSVTCSIHLLLVLEDSLRAGRSGNRIPVGGRDFPHPFRPTQPPIKWIPALFSGDKAAGAWR
jgi:hypothetical protein